MKEIPAHRCEHIFCSGERCTWPERRAQLIGEHLARHARQRREVALIKTAADAGVA